jgi:hypothetical protein
VRTSGVQGLLNNRSTTVHAATRRPLEVGNEEEQHSRVPAFEARRNSKDQRPGCRIRQDPIHKDNLALYRVQLFLRTPTMLHGKFCRF